MASEVHYSRAPIVEATLAIEVEPLAPDQLPKLDELARSISDRYPQRKPRIQSQFQISVAPAAGSGSSSMQFQDGFVCASADGKFVAQIALSGVTFSRLAPYTSWVDVGVPAKSLWRIYAQAFGAKPTVAAVRYINRIEIPIGEPMELYLRTYPEISRALPQLINQYYMRLELPLEKGVAVVQQTFVPSSHETLSAILLDNDLRFPVAGSDVWELISVAHDEKNRLFEASITDALRERIR